MHLGTCSGVRKGRQLGDWSKNVERTIGGILNICRGSFSVDNGAA